MEQIRSEKGQHFMRFHRCLSLPLFAAFAATSVLMGACSTDAEADGLQTRPTVENERKAEGDARLPQESSPKSRNPVPRQRNANASLPSALLSDGAPRFSNGVHLVNLDDAFHRFDVGPFQMTTKICEIARPTADIKRGIAEAQTRKPPGIEFATRLGDARATGLGGGTLEARIHPRTSVACLCVRPCAIELESGEKLAAPSGATIVIENGRLRLRPSAQKKRRAPPGK